MAILKDLIVHGSSRFLNKIYASEIQTPLIDAEAGVFKKLKADNATIVGLLDVQGQMHTNSWTNSNIATIDGSFYITPTLSSSSGTVSFSSVAAATFTGTYSAVSSLYIGNNTASTVQWTSGSKILITGEVQVNGEWIPLGTLLGTLNSTNPTTSMPVVSITDNRNNTSNILTDIYSLKGNASLSYRNLKVSLYQRADSSKYYPLGIFMTALGQNGKTFLDIYGGVNELTTSYGGYANPNVRIGNLSGLPAITTAAGNFTPVGWGIYTTNGYFSGTIVSNTGVIGGWKLGASSLYNGTTGLNNNTVGIYLGTDGIRNYSTSTQYVNITGGKIKAQGVDLTGKITASSGSIGGWNIGTDTNKSLYYGNQTPGATTTNLILSPTSTTNSNAIGGSGTGLTWFISAGKVFGVTTAGALYATSGKIGGWTIGTSSLYNSKSSYNNSNEGLYLGTDYIAGGAGEEWWFKKDGSAKIGAMTLSAAGVLSVPAANITGTLTASQVDVSGIVTAGSIVTNTLQGGTFNTTDYIRVSTQASSALTIGTSGSKTDWRILAGKTFGVDKAGNMYATSATISGNITATGGTIGGASITDGVLYITDANISGTISSNHIDASSISIGINQVTNLSTTLEGKQAAGDYATNTALNSVSTVANTALGQSSWYATCPTPGGTTEKVATITPTTTAFTLTEGATVNVKFDVKNTGAVGSITLNVNGTGAKNIKYINNNAISNIPGTDYIAAGRTYQFVYDGTYWVIQNLNYNTNTNTIGTLGATKLIAGTNASDASATTVYRYTLIMKKTIGTSPTWVSLVTSSSTATSKTRYTGGLYPDKIFYMSSNVSSSPYGYSTGASTGDSYAALGFDLRYSTNCGSTLVIGKPVYLVGEINSLDGLFYLDSTWWTQTEPTMEDGKTYIYLGNAYSTTNVYLVEKNPIMRYYRGAFRTEEQIAGMTATSYITYIDANNGIKVHNYNNVTDYIQINSDAISMYRRDTQQPQVPIETLRIQSDNIRIGKIGTGKRNVLITDNNIQIRNNTTVLASYGDEITFYRPDTSNSVLSINSSNIRIGQENYQNLLLKSNEILLKTGNKQSLKISPKELSYFFKNGNSPFYIKQLEKPQTATGDGSKKQFISNTSYFIQQLYGISINGIEQKEIEDYTYSISNGVCTVNFVSAPANNATIIFNYDIEYEIGQLLKTASDTDPSARKYIGLPQTCMEVLHVYVNNTETSAWHYPSFSVQGETITIHDYIQLNSDPGQGASIKVLYKKQAGAGFYMTMGIRKTGENDPGVYSLTVGKECMAEGQCSFAGGKNTAALGKYSFAYGDGGDSDSDCVEVNADCAGAIGKGLRINRTGGFACGTYNTYSPNYTWAFQVGNGTSAMDRSDAFGVASNGDIYTTGILMSGVVGRNPKTLFTTQVFSVDNIVVPATGGSTVAISGVQSVNVAIDGYIAIGLMSFLSQTATNNGANSTCVFPYAWWINQNYFRFSLRNTVASQVKTKITFRILYIAASAVQSSLFPSDGNA